MCRKSFLLLVTSLCAFNMAMTQETNWKNSGNWKLYDIRKQAGARYSLDTLRNFKSLDLNSDTVKTFLNGVTAWPAGKSSVWMGLYIATCETEDKKPRKIIISTYGGFFYDQATGRYYQIEPDLISQWLEFLNDASKSIHSNN